MIGPGSTPRPLLAWALSLIALSAAACRSPCDGQVTSDQDGDGFMDWNDRDIDGDGWRPDQGDCDDCDDAIGPNFADTSNDGVDQDCDGFDGAIKAAPTAPSGIEAPSSPGSGSSEGASGASSSSSMDGAELELDEAALVLLVSLEPSGERDPAKLGRAIKTIRGHLEQLEALS